MFVDRQTGEIRSVDSRELRVKHMLRRVRRWAEVVEPFWDDPEYLPIMLTLTYRPGVEWEPRHISDYMRKVRRRLGVHLVAYAVIAELQERGAVHFHILVVQLRGVWLPKPDKSGDWPHGASRVEKARSPYYAMKYSQKALDDSDGFPKGLRLFSVVLRKHVAKGSQLDMLRLTTIPYWLEKIVAGEVLAGSTMPQREPGGGWTFGGVSYDPRFGFHGIE
jgi:hypothetical protein